MQKTENYGLNKPESTDFYDVEDFNSNMDVVDEKLKEVEQTSSDNSNDIKQHTEDKENPHEVTKKQIGLENVPNVSTNNQTPTYTVPEELSELESGEKLSVAFGKIAKAIKSLFGIKDYIIEEGYIEETGAYYRKYANGVMEAWGMSVVEPVYKAENQSSSTSGIYWSDQVLIPIGVEFVSIKRIMSQPYHGGISWSTRTGYDNANKQIYTNIVQVGLTSRITYMHYDIRGTWKV